MVRSKQRASTPERRHAPGRRLGLLKPSRIRTPFAATANSVSNYRLAMLQHVRLRSCYRPRGTKVTH
ncbi:Uncharacterised protein [Mycobacteroides abscessus subsp. abscessus]|nr:Uncharacterised protein [Mycobacteroides abscessus subsp. abscessus]